MIEERILAKSWQTARLPGGSGVVMRVTGATGQPRTRERRVAQRPAFGGGDAGGAQPAGRRYGFGAPPAGVNASEKHASSCRPCATKAGRAASTMRTEPQA